MSSQGTAVDGKIAAYEARIEEHRAKIKQIEAGTGLYEGTTPAEKRTDIKSEKDGILACEAALQTLRQGQLGEFFSDASTRLSSSFQACFWLSVK